MINKFSFDNLYHYSLAFLLLLLCCFPKLIGLGVLVLFIVAIFGWIKKELFWKLTPLNLLLVGLYLSYLIGIAFTNHRSDAWSYAENKISFLLFPIIFSLQPKFKINWLPVLLGLAFGVVFASIYGIVNSIQLIIQNGWDLNYLVSVNISPIHHPTYFSFYIITAVSGLWLLYFDEKIPYHPKWLVVFTLFCGFIFLFCLSLASIIYLFVILGAIGLMAAKRRFGVKLTILIAVILPLFFLGICQFIPRIKFEVNNGLTATGLFLTDPIKYVKNKPGDKTGNEIRLVMWAATLLEIKDHPWGVGTGNVDEHLSSRLSNLGQVTLAKKDEKGHIRYNPHNQFLQTTLEIGFIGLILLLTYIISLLKLAWIHKNAFLAIIVGGLFFNALFESVLQRQSGIVFFSFMLSLFAISIKHYKSEVQC
jgi:O-antigen ligase